MSVFCHRSIEGFWSGLLLPSEERFWHASGLGDARTVNERARTTFAMSYASACTLPGRRVDGENAPTAGERKRWRAAAILRNLNEQT